MSEDEKCVTVKTNHKSNRKSPFSSKCVYGYSSNVEGLNDNTGKLNQSYILVYIIHALYLKTK